MPTLAEQNRADFDKFVESETDIESEYTGLNTRNLTSHSKTALAFTMERLTGSFSFECKPIFVDNGFGYEIEFPRIIIDDLTGETDAF